MVDTVLITGGAGFIGSRLAHRLHDAGYEVRLFDNFFRGRRENVADLVGEPDVELIRGDVRNYDAVVDAMAGADAVVHLAAICLNRSVEYPGESLAVNLIGSNTVFEAAVETDVDRVLAASSASVYGDQPIPMAETDRPAPQTPYGTAKIGLEHLLHFYGNYHDLDYVAYRFFNVYGPGQHTDAYYTSVINVFIERLLNGNEPVIHGSGEQTMDFVHVDDIARALELGLETENTREVVNVGSGEMTSITELATELVDIVGADVEPVYKDRDVVVSERQADTRHAADVLGFTTEVSVRQGLTDVVEWMKAERDSAN